LNADECARLNIEVQQGVTVVIPAQQWGRFNRTQWLRNADQAGRARICDLGVAAVCRRGKGGTVGDRAGGAALGDATAHLIDIEAVS
jgi:hypothetical protein